MSSDLFGPAISPPLKIICNTEPITLDQENPLGLSPIWFVWMSSSKSSSATFFIAFGFSANFRLSLSSLCCDCCCRRATCCCGRAIVVIIRLLTMRVTKHQPDALFEIISGRIRIIYYSGVKIKQRRRKIVAHEGERHSDC